MKVNSTKLIERNSRMTRNGRSKRRTDGSMKKILDKFPSIGHLGHISSRRKRDTLAHVDSIMEGIEDQLSGLQVSKV